MIRRRFSSSEIQEVEKLSGTMSKKALASHFGISQYVFDKIRESQSALEIAFQEGRKNSKFSKVKHFYEKVGKPQANQIVVFEDPWVEFQKKFAQDKRKRMLRELQDESTYV